MKTRLKNAIEKGIRGTGLPAVVRAIRWRGLLVLAYHNIVPEGEPVVGDVSLHLPQQEFARQLDWLCRTHDVVPLSTILDTPRETRRPRAAITFDDAYLGAVTVGARELAARDLAATIFVAPALIGAKGLWWDIMAPPGEPTLPSDMRRHCIDILQGRTDRVLAWAAERQIPIRSVPAHQSVATEDDLANAARTGRVTLASHGWSHPNLSRLDARSLREELERPLAWLAARFEHVIPWLTYPYGLASPATAEAARTAGYRGAFVVSGGNVGRTDLERHRYTLPRSNIPSGISLDGFALRASGLIAG